MSVEIEFFWDVGSPYSYLAATQLQAFEGRTGAHFRYRPFLLGGVFKAADNTMPAANPIKARYLVSDLARWRDYYQVPMKLPGDAPFPLNTITAMRLAVIAEREGFGKSFCTRVMHAYWVEGRNVSEAAELARVLQAEGKDPDKLLAATTEQPIKDALRAATDEAVRRGAFGAPSFFLGEELYWGNDRLPLLEARLRA